MRSGRIMQLTAEQIELQKIALEKYKKELEQQKQQAANQQNESDQTHFHLQFLPQKEPDLTRPLSSEDTDFCHLFMRAFEAKYPNSWDVSKILQNIRNFVPAKSVITKKDLKIKLTWDSNDKESEKNKNERNENTKDILIYTYSDYNDYSDSDDALQQANYLTFIKDQIPKIIEKCKEKINEDTFIIDSYLSWMEKELPTIIKNTIDEAFNKLDEQQKKEMKQVKIAWNFNIAFSQPLSIKEQLNFTMIEIGNELENYVKKEIEKHHTAAKTLKEQNNFIEMSKAFNGDIFVVPTYDVFDDANSKQKFHTMIQKLKNSLVVPINDPNKNQIQDKAEDSILYILQYMKVKTRLLDYIAERNKEKDYRKRDLFHRGFSKTEKIDAADALLKVIEGHSFEENLNVHLKALNDGRLKEIYKDYLEMKKITNTIEEKMGLLNNYPSNRPGQ